MSSLRSVNRCCGASVSVSSGALRLFSILCLTLGTVVASGQELVTKETDMQAIYFLDKYAIAQMTDMKHRFYQPVRIEDEMTIGGDPAKMTYFNVFYDQKQELYTIWYKSSANGPLCYAESRDGVHWDRPDLTDASGVDSSISNAVFNGKDGFKFGAVYYDPYDSDASRRYKLPYQEGAKRGYQEMRLAYSPDGIKWRIGPGPSWLPGVKADTGNNMIYNPFAKKWQIMTRVATAERRIDMVESADLKSWSEPVVIIHPGPDDPIGLEFYGMPVCQYEDIFLGLLWNFQTGTSGKVTANRNDGVIEPELTYSYNGRTWNRTYRTFIKRSQRGPYTGARIYPESILLDHEDRIRIYSKVFGHEHGSASDAGQSGVVLHELRKDGFAAVESIGFEGYLQTKLFVLKGDGLTLNVNAPYGSVKVQISNKNGKPYPGFSFEDCIEWRGDDVAHRPQWKDKKDLSDLRAKEVRFEIKLKEGILYAIRSSLNPGDVSLPIKRY